ncbi:glycosyltransferase [Deferrisoma camini]|uniref:glycosyltransferase n=1 Tax=Deferrisoma camini TaxID=1035120 RepID=UPI00046D5710|nr:glycosyltransferase [Deferrisoma camini]
MKIAFVNSTRKWGGVKSWTLTFGRALAQRGHRVLAVVRRENPFEAACRKAGFRVYPVRFGFKYDPVATARLVRVFRRERPDVVVVNISRDLEVGAVAARLCGVAVVRRVGLVEDLRGTAEERLQHRWLVNRVVVPARWMADALVSAHPWVPRGAVRVVLNGRNLEAYPPAGGSGEGAVVFGVTSQLSPSKGHGVLLDAAERLAKEGTPFRLKVAGTGGLRAELENGVASRGLGERVEFVGFLGDVRPFLQGVDAFVLPSLKEGLPNALLEAMATGLPCVASDLPGTREVGGDAVLLVPSGDPGALAEAMARVSKDPRLRRTLGPRARARVGTVFALEGQVSVLEQVLQEVAPR